MDTRIPVPGRGVKPAVFFLLTLAMLAGCTGLAYYGQSVTGHLDLMQRREPIPKLLANPSTDPQLRERLARVLSMREFASRKLGLPDNGSYRSYADLDRPYAVWTVVATPPLSLKPQQWCFLIVGCLNYRGYYELAKAEAYAAELAASGADTYVGGASAYSTLGWFNDPVLNTMLHWSDAHVARVIFHELAHQKLFVKNDTAFNEAFADTVAIVGAERWVKAHGDPGELAAFHRYLARENDFVDLVLTTRRRLQAVYASDRSDAAKLEAKQTILAELERTYWELRTTTWSGYAFYDPWFSGGLNNAKLAAVATYRELMPAFSDLLAQFDGDLEPFYAQVKALLPCSPVQRREVLLQPELESDCISARPYLANRRSSR